jgi:hypothetical protein
MPRPYANDPRRLYKSPPRGVGGLILLAFGIALLIGLVTGVLWIVINLLRLHVFR